MSSREDVVQQPAGLCDDTVAVAPLPQHYCGAEQILKQNAVGCNFTAAAATCGNLLRPPPSSWPAA